MWLSQIKLVSSLLMHNISSKMAATLSYPSRYSVSIFSLSLFLLKLSFCQYFFCTFADIFISNPLPPIWKSNTRHHVLTLPHPQKLYLLEKSRNYKPNNWSHRNRSVWSYLVYTILCNHTPYQAEQLKPQEQVRSLTTLVRTAKLSCLY